MAWIYTQDTQKKRVYTHTHILNTQNFWFLVINPTIFGILGMGLGCTSKILDVN
jgi:hypothetical protein